MSEIDYFSQECYKIKMAVERGPQESTLLQQFPVRNKCWGELHRVEPDPTRFPPNYNLGEIRVRRRKSGAKVGSKEVELPIGGGAFLTHREMIGVKTEAANIVRESKRKSAQSRP